MTGRRLRQKDRNGRSLDYDDLCESELIRAVAWFGCLRDREPKYPYGRVSKRRWPIITRWMQLRGYGFSQAMLQYMWRSRVTRRLNLNKNDAIRRATSDNLPLQIARLVGIEVDGVTNNNPIPDAPDPSAELPPWPKGKEAGGMLPPALIRMPRSLGISQVPPSTSAAQGKGASGVTQSGTQTQDTINLTQTGDQGAVYSQAAPGRTTIILPATNANNANQPSRIHINNSNGTNPFLHSQYATAPPWDFNGTQGPSDSAPFPPPGPPNADGTGFAAGFPGFHPPFQTASKHYEELQDIQHTFQDMTEAQRDAVRISLRLAGRAMGNVYVRGGYDVATWAMIDDQLRWQYVILRMVSEQRGDKAAAATTSSNDHDNDNSVPSAGAAATAPAPVPAPTAPEADLSAWKAKPFDESRLGEGVGTEDDSDISLDGLPTRHAGAASSNPFLAAAGRGAPVVDADEQYRLDISSDSEIRDDFVGLDEEEEEQEEEEEEDEDEKPPPQLKKTKNPYAVSSHQEPTAESKRPSLRELFRMAHMPSGTDLFGRPRGPLQGTGDRGKDAAKIGLVKRYLRTTVEDVDDEGEGEDEDEDMLLDELDNEDVEDDEGEEEDEGEDEVDEVEDGEEEEDKLENKEEDEDVDV
ncbi:hypothetical protein JX265_000638 [Neoarthrinium moseri]|uniref:Uncharacterized protein n=1 Tax=Neoarthrinium moseri TaxID=1658444 RepID=A0A9P9WYX7_9PEZI|nr:hypothetical protein JX265_000638 [Neoarthrinium moseri]